MLTRGKTFLEGKDCAHNSENNYWELSNLIIDKNECNSNYLVNKQKQKTHTLLERNEFILIQEQ